MAIKRDETDDAPILAVDELSYREVGVRLRELSDQLRAVADFIDDEKFHQNVELAYEHGAEDLIAQYDTDTKSRFRKTLSGLRAYRRNYNFWERVIAEYALTKMNYTQRDTAALLGVGVSTINRWAQNPLPIEEYR